MNLVASSCVRNTIAKLLYLNWEAIMALLYSDGFEHYVPKGHSAAGIKKYLEQAGYVVQNDGLGLAIVDGTDENTLALRLTLPAGGATPPSVGFDSASEAGLMAWGFGWRAVGKQVRIARINDTIDVDWDKTTGRIVVDDIQGANVIIRDAWLYLEVVVDRVNEELRVYANNVIQVTAPLPQGLAAGYSIEWGGQSDPDTTTTIDIDDFVVVDSSAGQYTDRIGPIATVIRPATADTGPNEWTLVGSASATHYGIVSQLDPGRAAAPYLQANVDGRKEMFSSNTVLPAENDVLAVVNVLYARKGDLDDRAVGLVVDSSGTEVEVTAPLTEEPRFHCAVYEQAPGSVPWTKALVEGSKFGFVAR
ncbi:hypothetical protein ACMHYJ_01990 [Castellaniella hirudinis]|uniref:hypothetical protein n=1 Tax=Castellaniella hirudinis TaxID=1144617 RepID=UPI0039C24B5B